MTIKNNTLILARSEKGVLALNGEMPWYVPTDLRRFVAISCAHDFMLMGRRTFDDLPGGRALPGRKHLVVTSSPRHRQALHRPSQGEVYYLDWQEAERALRSDHSICVIGGAEIAKLALPMISNIYLTTVKNIEVMANDGDEVTVFDYNPYHDFELMEFVDDGDAIYERFRRRDVK